MGSPGSAAKAAPCEVDMVSVAGLKALESQHDGCPMESPAPFEAAQRAAPRYPHEGDLRANARRSARKLTLAKFRSWPVCDDCDRPVSGSTAGAMKIVSRRSATYRG